jgi:hypothetical protein
VGTTAELVTADISDIAAAQRALNWSAPAMNSGVLPYPEQRYTPVRFRASV